jgi:hypothetical protein
VTSNIHNYGNYMRSVVLTGLVTFCFPLLLIGGIFVSLLLVRQLPPLMPISQQGTMHLRYFLTTFGNGDPWQGSVIISLCSSFVGVLFDTYTFYHRLGIGRR